MSQKGRPLLFGDYQLSCHPSVAADCRRYGASFVAHTILNLNVHKYCEWIFRCVKATTCRLAGDAKLVLQGGKSKGFNADAAEKTPQDCLYLG